MEKTGIKCPKTSNTDLCKKDCDCFFSGNCPECGGDLIGVKRFDLTTIFNVSHTSKGCVVAFSSRNEKGTPSQWILIKSTSSLYHLDTFLERDQAEEAGADWCIEQVVRRNV